MAYVGIGLDILVKDFLPILSSAGGNILPGLSPVIANLLVKSGNSNSLQRFNGYIFKADNNDQRGFFWGFNFRLLELLTMAA